MSKKNIRKKYKTLRQQLSDNILQTLSIKIANQVLKLDIWQHNFYHIFLPINTQNEINTEYILNILSGKDKHIVVPKTNFTDFSMSHFLLTDATTLKKNSYGIPEPIEGIAIQPQQLDVVFIPLLAFDYRGHRLGYGKGCYDRFLHQCQPQVIKIGLSCFDAQKTPIHTNKDDVALDFCVTPKTIYKF